MQFESAIIMDVGACEAAPMTDVTRILPAIEQGESSAAEKLLPLVYEELRKLATGPSWPTRSPAKLLRQLLSCMRRTSGWWTWRKPGIGTAGALLRSGSRSKEANSRRDDHRR
jgi:hypothetical protein